MKGVTTKWDTEDEKLQEIRDAYRKIHDLKDSVNFWERQYDRLDMKNQSLDSDYYSMLTRMLIQTPITIGLLIALIVQLW